VLKRLANFTKSQVAACFRKLSEGH